MTQREIAEAFVDTPTRIATVKVKRWKYLPFTRTIPIEIKGLSLGKVQLIAAEFDEMMSGQDISDMTASEQINKILRSGIPALVRVIGISVCKGGERPSKMLLDAIKGQLDVSKLHEAVTEVYRRLDLSTFFDIMTLVKGLNISLSPDREAPGQQS